MNVQHLSDEAVAAYADGVLHGHSRERAARHVESCVECRAAVRVQREAAFALRAAVAPVVPSSLADRLRTVPLTTPIGVSSTALPSVLAADGKPMFAAFAPAAALVPAAPAARPPGSRTKPAAVTFAAVALAGALTAGSMARQADEPAPGPGSGSSARQISTTHDDPAGSGAALFRADRP